MEKRTMKKCRSQFIIPATAIAQVPQASSEIKRFKLAQIKQKEIDSIELQARLNEHLESITRKS